MVKRRAITTFFLCCLIQMVLIGQTGIVNIGWKEGLPSMAIHEVSQDSAGWVWVATETGLVKWTGSESLTYTTADGLPRNDIRKVYHLPDGSAWVLTSGALAFMSPDQSFAPAALPEIQETRIFSTHRDRDKNQWFVGEYAIFCLTHIGQTVLSWQIRDLMVGDAPALEPAWRGNGLLISGSAGLALLDTTGPRKQWRMALSPSHDHRAPRLIRQQEGYLLATSTGWRRADNELTCSASSIEGVPSPDASLLPITYMGKSGLLALDQHKLTLFLSQHVGYQPSNLLSTLGSCSGFFLDNAQNLWLAASDGGLTLVSASLIESAFLSYKVSTQLAEAFSGTCRVMIGRGNSLLLGSDAGEVALVQEGQQIITWNLPSLLSSHNPGPVQQVSDLVLGSSFWLAKWNTTLVYGQTENAPLLAKTIDGFTGLIRHDDLSVMISLQDRFHFWLPNSGIAAFMQNEGDPFIWLKANSTWVQMPFSTMAVKTSDNTFWTGWEDGLSHIDQIEKEDLSPSSQVFLGEYLRLALWGKNTVIAAAGAGGIEVYREKNKVWPGSNDVAWQHGSVTGVIADSLAGKILVVSDRGVFQFEGLPQNGLPYHGRLLPYQPLDQWEKTKIALLHNNIALLTEGQITLIPIEEPPISAKLSLTCLKWSGGNCDLAWSGIRKISKDSASLELHIASNAYRYLFSQRIEYSLNDKEWMGANDGRVSFFALPSGSYHLRGRVMVGQQEVVPPESLLQWVVNPPMYQSWWFVLGISLIVVGLIWAVIRLYYSENKQKWLEELVAERTESLDQSIRELKRSNEDLEHFAYIASHDLKSPLRSMIGHMQLLQRRYGEAMGEKGVESITHTVNEAKRLYAMVSDLLHFASVGSAKMDKESISLKQLVASIELSMILTLKERNARIEYGDLPTVEAVPSQWEALFRNLIENGIKFNESARPKISIEARPTDGFWIFIFTDNGIGMDPSHVEKAFELYGRLNPEFPGTGIGLAICKRVVERHGGTMWVETESGKGSTFYVTIPR